MGAIEDNQAMDVTSPPPYNHQLSEDDFRRSEQKELKPGDIWYVVPVHSYNLYKNIAKGNSNLHSQELNCSTLLDKVADKYRKKNQNRSVKFFIVFI